MCFCIKSSIGTQGEVSSCKSALTPPLPHPKVVYSTDRSKAVVSVLVLLFVAFWFILRGDSLYVFQCVIFFFCFSVLLVLRLPRLVKRELIVVFFVRLFDLCLFGRFPLPLGVWEGLRFVIVALPGLFSYLFFSKTYASRTYASAYISFVQGYGHAGRSLLTN